MGRFSLWIELRTSLIHLDRGRVVGGRWKGPENPNFLPVGRPPLLLAFEEKGHDAFRCRIGPLLALATGEGTLT